MTPLPQFITILLASFIPCFKQSRTFRYLVDFFIGFVLNGRKTITGIFSRAWGSGHFTNYYRFLKNYKWNIYDLTARLLVLIQSKIDEKAANSKLHRENMFLVLDSTFSEKTGKKFDGVGSFFDHSGKPNSPRFIWGHCIFILGFLFEITGFGWTCFPFLASLYFRKKTIEEQNLDVDFVPMLEKAVGMVEAIKGHCNKTVTVVADAFFSKKTFFGPLFEQGIHVLSRCRHDAIAWEPAPAPKVKKRGRPRKYGGKVKLKNLLQSEPLSKMQTRQNGRNKTVQYVVKDLLVRGFAAPVRFMVIKDKIPVILMTTNLELSAPDMLRVYCARFQIEFCIRDMKQHLGITQYQVRRGEAVARFLNIAIAVYSLLKVAFYTERSLQSTVLDRLNLPWRTKTPGFSFEQVLEAIRMEIFTRRFFHTSPQIPEQEKIPGGKKNTSINECIKC